MTDTTTDTNTDTTTTTEETEKRTATNSYRFSGESGGYQAYKPNEWTQPKEVLFSSFQITETDLRVKTATFKSPQYTDLTKGRACCWIQRKHGENFGGVILKCEEDSETGLYNYTCQDWNRLLTNKVYVVLNGEWTVYKVITKLLVECNISTDGLQPIESYDGMNEEVPTDDDPTETNTSSVGTTTSDTSESTEENKKSSATVEKETKLMKGNSFRQKPQGLYDKISARDFILALLMKEGVNIDIHFDENGVLHFDRYEKDTWLKERWYFVDTDVYDSHLTFDITDVITQVAVKHVDALDGKATLYTSEKLLGVNIASFFGVMGTVIDNPTKSSGNSSSANDGNTITLSGKPSAGRCCAKNYGGVTPPYKTVTRSYKNYCVMCKKSGTLADTPKNPSRNRVAEGEVSCTACGADYCICCGAEKDGSCRSNLIKAGSSTPTTTSSTTSSSSSSSNSSKSNTGGNVSSTNSSTSNTNTSTDTTTTDGSTVAVESYYKNKIAARIAFSESIRKWFTFTIKLPGEYNKLHTNSFCMFMMSEKFALENLPTIGKKLNGKFTRYVGYEKNRYYIEKVVVTCDNNIGLTTELTLNPFASDYSTYSKTQIQAEESLASALGGGGSGDRASIFAKAAKWRYGGGGSGSSASDPEVAYKWTEANPTGPVDCFGASASLYYQFSHFTSIPVRIMVGWDTGSSGTHRTIQLKENGTWIDPPEYSNMTANLRPIKSDKSRHVYNNYTTEP